MSTIPAMTILEIQDFCFYNIEISTLLNKRFIKILLSYADFCWKLLIIQNICFSNDTNESI